MNSTKVVYESTTRGAFRFSRRLVRRAARPAFFRTRRSFSSFVFVHHLHERVPPSARDARRSSPAGNLHRGWRRPIDSVARPQLAPRVPSPRANRPVLRNSRRVPRPARHAVEHVRGRRDALSSRAPRTDVRELDFVVRVAANLDHDGFGRRASRRARLLGDTQLSVVVTAEGVGGSVVREEDGVCGAGGGARDEYAVEGRDAGRARASSPSPRPS